MKPEERGLRKVNPKLIGEKTMKTLLYINEHKIAHASEIAKVLGLKTFHVLQYLYYLEKKGLVERHWRAWCITPLGKEALKEYLDYLEKLKELGLEGGISHEKNDFKKD